jgi:hypothetical protein
MILPLFFVWVLRQLLLALTAVVGEREAFLEHELPEDTVTLRQNGRSYFVLVSTNCSPLCLKIRLSNVKQIVKVVKGGGLFLNCG